VTCVLITIDKFFCDFVYIIGGNICVLVQHECIPQAILSMDVLCQAKSGMGKTAVFVLATLQQLEPVDGQVKTKKCTFYVKNYCENVLKKYDKTTINMCFITQMKSLVYLLLVPSCKLNIHSNKTTVQ